MKFSGSLGWNICAHKSSTVFLSISLASLSTVFIYDYFSINNLIYSSNLTSYCMSIKLFFEKYDMDIRICISTETGMFNLMIKRRFSKIILAISWLESRNEKVCGECIILANIADEKSKQKMWYSFYYDIFINSIIQCINWLSRIIGIIVSFTLHFYKMEIQNLYITLPYSEPLSIFIIILIIDISFLYVIYSTPFSVDAIIEIIEVIACLRD